ncbi:MAG TPA: hypothetical protein VF403_21625 [Kofleriaceae bacterium]
MKSTRLGCFLFVAACGAGGSQVELSLISPPVRAATPPALQSASRTQHVDDGLSASDLHDRFFSGAGPTDVMQLIGSVDDRITEINGAGPSPCFDAAPVDVMIMPAGQSIVLPAQCMRMFGSDGFMQFAVVDGATSIYAAVGQARFAAIVTPDDVVDAWYGVGYQNATSCGGSFDGCSYGLTELHANATSHAFELAVAGIGEGYCGAQLQSDGTSIYAVGSLDMGETCRDTSTLCVSASDLTMPGTCASAPIMQTTAVGRHAGGGAHMFGASTYPAMPNVTLDGSETDSLHFGPSAPSDGVASF